MTEDTEEDEFSQSIKELIAEAATLGHDRIVFPIDIFNLAYRFSMHAERETAVPALVSFLDDPDNHFARFVSLRALRVILGHRASSDLRQRVVGILRSDGPATRAEACRFLADAAHAGPEVLAVLREIEANDDTTYVRDEASNLLKDLLAQLR